MCVWVTACMWPARGACVERRQRGRSFACALQSPFVPVWGGEQPRVWRATPPDTLTAPVLDAGACRAGGAPTGWVRSTVGTVLTPPPRLTQQGRDSGGSCCSDSGGALKRKRPPLLDVSADISSWPAAVRQLRPHLSRRHSAPDGWKPDPLSEPVGADTVTSRPVRSAAVLRGRTVGTRVRSDANWLTGPHPLTRPLPACVTASLVGPQLRTSSDTHTDNDPSALLVYVDRLGDTDHVDGRCSALTALSAMSLEDSRTGGSNAESLTPRTSLALRRVSSELLLWPPQALDVPNRWVPGT